MFVYFNRRRVYKYPKLLRFGNGFVSPQDRRRRIAVSEASRFRYGIKITTYISCPTNPNKTLGIKLPFLVMIVKNLKRYFTFEVQIIDDKNIRRRFRASNYQSTTRVKPFICTMPMRLDEGWNQIQFNLSDFTRRAYGTNYLETLRVQIHANCRIRRVYFCDRLYSEDELPAEFKLYLPIKNKQTASVS
ncbi:Cilia and flagella-associated protein 20 [Taenia crassiceps]|uniref:Cilia and flagella-associated protein 20 n=1 Tax=Taenia crassiceps TaxID=6207 RepID=A0ABR4Q0W4_9CEST